jgi:hypothetical protein
LEEVAPSIDLPQPALTGFAHLTKTYQLGAPRSATESGLQLVPMISAYEEAAIADFGYDRLSLMSH